MALLVEFGMGTSLQRCDYTDAATRAVRDALWRHSVLLAELYDRAREDMVLDVTVGVQLPERVDPAALEAVFPYGRPRISVVRGGLDTPRPEGGAPTVMANAAIAISFEGVA